MVISLVVYVGLVLFANYSHCDPFITGRLKSVDELLPYYVTQRTQEGITGLPGLLVASVFAAAMSTLSSGFNSIAALMWEDFLKARITGWINLPEDKEIFFIKGLAAAVGLVCMSFAFIVGEIGNMYEAAITLSGAAVGPIFGLFILGMFVPFVNKWGATVGLIVGQFFCFWIVIGSVSEKKPNNAGDPLFVSSESCPWDVPMARYIPFAFLKDNMMPKYYPEGMKKLYHVSQYMIPVIGMISALFFGIVVSLLTGANRGKPIDPRYMFSFDRQITYFKRLFRIGEFTHGSDSDEGGDGQHELNTLNGVPIPSVPVIEGPIVKRRVDINLEPDRETGTKEAFFTQSYGTRMYPTTAVETDLK